MSTATVSAVRRGLGFKAPSVVWYEFRCVSILPLWFLHEFQPLVASSGLVKSLLRDYFTLPTATARAVGWSLGFDTLVVISHEFHCISILSLYL